MCCGAACIVLWCLTMRPSLETFMPQCTYAVDSQYEITNEVCLDQVREGG